MKRKSVLNFARNHPVLIGILAVFSIYPVSLLWIHTSNARHERTWDAYRDHAHQSGIPLRPTPDPLDLVHFYDESQPFRTAYGLTSHKQGFKNAAGEIVIEPTYYTIDKHFYEGLAFAITADKTRGYIRPDESLAFEADFDYVDSFVNGRARVRSRPGGSKPFRTMNHGFIDTDGNVVVEVKYYGARDYIGEYAFVVKRTTFTPLYDGLMDGIDIDIGLGWLLPPRAAFVDKDGNQVSPSTLKRAMK
ncbi:MAG: WG repeat-containing protein [Planctomycetota bacterium]